MTAQRPSVAILGDLMLDVFSEGSVSRLSPEAPVPILANPTNREVLGGAGNTAVNIDRLGAAATLVAAIGNDSPGEACVRLLRESDIAAQLVTTDSCQTTVKSRFLAGGHQILRLDVESADFNETDARELIAASQAALEGANCLVVSDYQKGVVSADVALEVMSLAAAAEVPVVVDSKRRDFAVFRGAHVISPNHLEATQATGETDPERAAHALAALTQGSVIVTLGPDGMLVAQGDSLTRVPSVVREVADVTGAGDTVTAALAVAISEGADLVEAARWATLAAAVAVEHTGTYGVHRSEVDSLAERMR